jgi:hypothetical protein
MKKKTAGLLCLLGLLPGLRLPALADEGMWTLDHPPLQRIQKAYGTAPSKEWMNKAMLASARLTLGCSASFVSKEGLILTNHHCASQCLEQLSDEKHNLLQEGFLAVDRASERQCPAMEVDRLEQISDVTKDVAQATAGLQGPAFKEAKNAVEAHLTSACAGADTAKVRCDVVELYAGGEYALYRYHRFQDVRLVFAPEVTEAFFGGDPDNFNFPRYDLDMSMVRVYENGGPAQVANYFPVSPKGPEAGQLVFTIGHPGSTHRESTVAQLRTQRDLVLPSVLYLLAEYRGVLEQYRSGGAEPARFAADELFFVENSFKALKGYLGALLDERLMQLKGQQETALRAYSAKHPARAGAGGDPWKAIEAAQDTYRDLFSELSQIEQGGAFFTDYFPIARRLVRGAAERPLPDAKRLPEFNDSRLPEVEAELFSPAPIHNDFEKLRLAFALTKLRETLGADHPTVRKLLGKDSPQELAARLVDGTRLADIAVRRKLWEGGQAAIDASDDPFIRFVRAIDPRARELRKRYEAQVEAVESKNFERISKVRFAREGKDTYPDATFSLRLSYGAVKGWTEAGVPVPPFTYIGGAFDRATGADPFRLPDSWIKAKDRLDASKPFNFVSDNDIIGGNSGSPVVAADGRLVGLIFDGNIHSLGGDFWFDDSKNRAVSVDSAAILEAMDKVYGAGALVKEMLGN